MRLKGGIMGNYLKDAEKRLDETIKDSQDNNEEGK
jgi:hypothetical protein